MTLHHGDCLEVMAGMEPESVDAVVTDPPYGLEFMGKEWDRPWRTDETRERTTGRQSTSPLSGKPRYGTASRFMQEWHEAWAREAYRVAKPSAYLLAFGGTRTVHRLTCAIEDAGWIIRDMLVWAYASGFPKSKASLKPAWEPIVMARKPGPLRMLAVDACRIGTDEETARARYPVADDAPAGMGKGLAMGGNGSPLGRWPANVILTDPIFDGGWEGVVGGGETNRAPEFYERSRTDFDFTSYPIGKDYQQGYGDSGTYSRFFLIPKADRADREPVLGGLPESDELRGSSVMQTHCAKCGRQRVNVPGAACSCPDPEWVRDKSQRARANVHPTVKPVDLMRHLVRLVTPTGGTVLDPFGGSGSTALAAEMEGFPWILIEKELEYVAIAEARLNGTQRGLGLPA